MSELYHFWISVGRRSKRSLHNWVSGGHAKSRSHQEASSAVLAISVWLVLRSRARSTFPSQDIFAKGRSHSGPKRCILSVSCLCCKTETDCLNREQAPSLPLWWWTGRLPASSYRWHRGEHRSVCWKVLGSFEYPAKVCNQAPQCLWAVVYRNVDFVTWRILDREWTVLEALQECSHSSFLFLVDSMTPVVEG